ncbi:conserved protein of unknown function [Thermococcus nautili]|uniref:hypothetical protein n=1 Tax=Thermococcus nautili TaxID=195522 RepID=UPI0025570054|nr:hypothetical protein [Thermococcus nautili]CAI1493609.1 conserved protein of unknown function [Thermococcus nautili]
MKYFVVVSYDDDAERKRVDYLLSKWAERADVEKPRGMTFIIETEHEKEFFEELFSRIEGNPSEKVRIYRVTEEWPALRERSATREYLLAEEEGFVRRFLAYLCSKLGGTFSPEEGTCEVYTRKGRGVIQFSLRGTPRGTVVRVTVSGYGEVVDYLLSRVDEELKPLAGDSYGTL